MVMVTREWSDRERAVRQSAATSVGNAGSADHNQAYHHGVQF